jgi:hypothetical protein
MWIADVWHSILVFFGVYDEAGPGYGFWSGFGSIIVQPGIVVGIVLYLRHHNCHAKGCWRVGKIKHTQDGQEYLLCKTHHPRAELTADAIRAAD